MAELNKERLHPEKHFTKRGSFTVKWVKNPDQPGVTKMAAPDKDSIKAFHESMKKYNLTKLPGFDVPLDKIRVNLEGDINSHAVLTWTDRTGRSQRAYTQEFEKRNAEKKWQTAAKFNSGVIDLVKKKSKDLLTSENEKESQAAAIINIIANTGLRVGDLDNYKYTENRGVSTLYPSDIEIKGNKVLFDFKGKSHKQNTAEIKDKFLATYLKELKEKNKDEKFLFNQVDRAYVDNVFKKKLKFNFKLKDMRTYTACAVAKNVLFEDFGNVKEIIEGIKDVKKKKTVVLKKINETCKKVADVLNNTPAMARKSYIAPQIFDDYIMRLSMAPADFKKAIEDGLSGEKEVSLDDIFDDFPPTKDEIKIDEEDEEFDEEYPLPSWITEEDFKEFFKSIEIDLEKGGVGSGKYIHKKNFSTYDELKKHMEKRMKEYESKNHFYASDEYKELYPIVEKLSKEARNKYYGEESQKGSKAMIEAGVKIGDKVIYDYIDPFMGVTTYTGKIVDKKGIPFVKLDNDKTLSGKKSIKWNKGWQKLEKGIDLEFVTNNSILTEEAFDLLEKGIIPITGFWNVDLEKAVKDLSKYRKVKRVVHRGGKTYLQTFYISRDSGERDDRKSNLLMGELKKHHDFSEGDEVSFLNDKGERIIAKVKAITTSAKKGSDSKIVRLLLQLEDGSTVTKALDKLEPHLPSGKEESKGKVDKPSLQSEIKNIREYTVEERLGGSGENEKIKFKGSNAAFVLKKQRNDTDAASDQLENENIANALYNAFIPGSAPASRISKLEDGKLGLINPFIEGHELGGYWNRAGKAEREEVKYKMKKSFIMDCLLANWDVIGADGDNVMVDEEGNVVRIDNGGSLTSRAKGARKLDSAFLDSKIVVELESFRKATDFKGNIFNHVTDKEIVDQIDELKKSPVNDLIKQLQEKTGEKRLIGLALKRRIDYLYKWADEKRSKKEGGHSEKEEEFDKSKYPSAVTQEYFENGWDELELEGNKGIKDAIKKKILEIENSHEYIYNAAASELGITMGELKRKLQANLEKLISKSNCFRATDASHLPLIFSSGEGGRFKSQFEVGDSHGSYNPRYRASEEFSYFGFEEDVKKDVSKRPIYGYLTTNNNGVQNRNGKIPPSNSTAMYGGLTLKVNREKALKKATFCCADSLGSSDSMACTPFAKPHFTSLNVYDTKGLIQFLSKDNFSKIDGSAGVGRYVEVQYHDQLTSKDLESIHFEKEGMNISLLNSVINLTHSHKFFNIKPVFFEGE